MVTINDAKEATKAIVEALQPVSVVVFGSVAVKGQGADLDLLVITGDEGETSGEADLRLHRCLKTFYKRFAIDPFIVPLSVAQEHYFRGSPFLNLIVREGKVLYMKTTAREWLGQGKEELNMTEYLIRGGYYRGACYHAQQAIEKTVKARLFAEGWELEKTHSLQRLLAIGDGFNLKFDLSDEDVVFIDSIYRSRYPAEAGLLPLGEPSKAEAERAMGIARRLFDDVQAIVGGSLSADQG